MEPSPGPSRAADRLVRPAALALYALVLTATLQVWVGRTTLYSPEHAAHRLLLHDILIGREPVPDGMTLNELGLEGCDRRIVIPRLAEGLARLTGRDVLWIYYALDSVALLAGFLLFWRYLRRWFDEVTALAGLTFLATSFVTTYYMHVFHPWDRVVFLLWLGMVMLLRDQRFGGYLALLTLTLFVKFTAGMFPLFFLILFRRTLPRRRLWFWLAAQAVVIAASHLALDRIAPTSGRLVAASYFVQLPDIFDENLRAVADYRFAHPLFLMLAAPAFLAASRFGRLRPELRDLAWCTVPYMAVHLVSLIVESRAYAGALIFLMPGALAALESLRRQGEASGPGAE